MARRETHPALHFDVHDRCRKAREHAELEQVELAELIEVDRGTVSNYETGKVKRSKAPVLKRWALACRVSFDWLATGGAAGPDDGPGHSLPYPPWDSNPEPAGLPHVISRRHLVALPCRAAA